MDEEEIIPTTIRKKKTTVYILSAYLKPRLTYKAFLKKGQKINLKPVKSYSFPALPDAKDYTYRNFHAIQYVDKHKGSVLVCSKDHVFQHNLKKDVVEVKPQKHTLEKVCNLNIWKNYRIYCPASKGIIFMNKNEGIQSYKTEEAFCGDFSGGYNAFSRNSEIYDSLFFFIDTAGQLRLVKLNQELIEKPAPRFSIFTAAGDSKTVNTIIISYNVNYFFLAKNKVYYSTREGQIYEIAEPITERTKANPKSNMIVQFREEFTTMNYFHHNVVGGSFQVSDKTSCLHLYNIKTKQTTELKIENSPKPIHKIEMFVKNKLTFGIAVNKGFDLHVFGIHLCKMYMFRAKVSFSAEYTSGILFVEGEKDTVLVFGDKESNMKYRIVM